MGFLLPKCSLLEYSILSGCRRSGGGAFSSSPVEQEARSTGDQFDLRLPLQDYPLISTAKARLRSASN